MGCLGSKDADDAQLEALGSSIFREDLAKLSAAQLRRRLRELGSNMGSELDGRELVDWVLLRNLLNYIFGDDDSKVFVALRVLKEVELSRQLLTSALTALGSSQDPESKNAYRQWAAELESAEAKEQLRKLVTRRTLVRGARGFLLSAGTLQLQAILREWHRVCRTKKQWTEDNALLLKGTDADDDEEESPLQHRALGDTGGSDDSACVPENGLAKDLTPVIAVDPTTVVLTEVGPGSECKAPPHAQDPLRKVARDKEYEALDAELTNLFEDDVFDSLASRVSSKSPKKLPPAAEEV